MTKYFGREHLVQRRALSSPQCGDTTSGIRQALLLISKENVHNVR